MLCICPRQAPLGCLPLSKGTSVTITMSERKIRISWQIGFQRTINSNDEDDILFTFLIKKRIFVVAHINIVFVTMNVRFDLKA